MPFFDDTGVRTEEHRGPLLSAFALLLDQIERMVVLNLLWAAQFVPLLLAYLISLPTVVRLALLACNGFMVFPLTGMLYTAIRRASEGELLRVELVLESLRASARRSAFVLAPLWVIFLGLVLAAIGAASVGWLFLDVLVRLAILLLGVCSLYWGPLFAANVQDSAWVVLCRSAALCFKYPALTVLTGCAVLLVVIVGTFSVGGLFLVVPVLVALLETQLYRQLTRRKEERI
jgi:hypothetical protein